MTREEAINKYEEALERARKYYNELRACRAKEKLEEIFPELRESVDERIRKRLLWFLANYNGKWDYPESRMACRAWLEKQKEQKPEDEQFPPLEGLDAIKAKYYDEGFKNGFDEGVESVKPAEWSEEDELKMNDLLNYLDPDKGGTKYSSCAQLTEWCNWLKSLRPRL